jgi:protein involved in polysaccharide export with SLBB domain
MVELRQAAVLALGVAAVLSGHAIPARLSDSRLLAADTCTSKPLTDEAVVFVIGHVKHGGSFRLEPGMTVSQAIARAGGIAPRGDVRGGGDRVRIEIRRTTQDGTSILIASMYDRLLDRDVVVVKREIKRKLSDERRLPS